MINTHILSKINNKRFKSGIEYQKQLLSLSRKLQDSLLQNLPSNYSKDRNTNLSEFFLAVSKEFARLQISSSDVNEDKYNAETRTEYLFQILGDSLFLGEKAINESLCDTDYRSFLLKVRNAYYEGSRKQNIESAVSDIVGLPVTVRELYLDLRKQSSFYGLKDTHKMFFDILMDESSSATAIGLLLEDLKFFIDIIKPAHVLYDTRLVWTDSFTNRNKACSPVYSMQDMEYVVYDTSIIFLITYLSSKIYKFSGTDPGETWMEGTIQAIDIDNGIFFLVDGRILVYDKSTELYVRDIDGDSRVLPSVFSVGDIIKYYATKDAHDSSDIIDSTWEWTGIIDDLNMNEKMITLMDGSLIVYNDTTLIYTRDYYGEYRIEIDDLSPNREIAFKANKYNKQFQFYKKPEAIEEDFFRQFDRTLIDRPTFQENVIKDKDIPEGTHEGYDLYVENGVAIIKNIQTKFYKRSNIKNEKEVKLDKYTLYINGSFEKQFQLQDSTRTLTQTEAKNVFIDSYGYTGLQDSNVDYNISIATTGQLIQNGENSIVQTIGDQTEFCDRKAVCQLMPLYEDTRKYWMWPDLQLTSGFFDVTFPFLDISDNIGEHNTPAWFYLSSDPNTYTMPYLPMLGPQGLPAGISDVTVYINGKKIENAISSIDPWTGIVSLNFIPPFETRLRIDYYYSKRYPNSVYYLKNIIANTVQTPENNIAGVFNVLNPEGIAPKLTWPYSVTDPALYGDDRDYQVNKFPMLNNKGELVAKEEISVFVGSPLVSGTVRVTEIDDTGSILTNISAADWSVISDGDTIVLQVKNYLDETFIYQIESVDLLNDTIRVPNVIPILGSEYPYTIIHFIEVPESVDAVRPLLGHVRLNFLPPINTFLRFNYYYTPQSRNYLMLPDSIAVTNPDDEYGSSSYTADTFYGSKNNYTLLVDQNPDIFDEPFWNFDELLKVGHRYRAFSLSHSAVLNSEQLKLYDYESNADKASFKNRVGLINQYSLMFSPEFLYDTDKNVVLNDKYLKKELPPVTVLNPGIPIFSKTFTDDAHHTIAYRAIEHDTYDPDLVGGMDLVASFTIIDPDDSGIIDYNPVCSMPEMQQINLYSDLKQVQFYNGGYDAPIQTIDEGGTSLPFKFSFIEQYYPNRELRLVDYLDYINQVPTEYRYGSLRVLNESSIVKSIEKNFKALNVGDTFTIRDVPYQEEIGGVWTIVRKNRDFTVIQIIDFETIRISNKFNGPSGTYNYELTRNKVYAVDVSLNEVNRTLILNGELGYSYGIPDTILQHLPGYGETGVHFEMYFPDPDPDPYPRNPDNQWISNPTGISYYNLSEYVIDGKTYHPNRLNATTGIIRTSQIIDELGNSYGYTGVSSGYTGPSGALDLGITGPVGDVNPRIYKASDSYVIPSGDTGIYLSFSEAEYRVQWRNWDQNLILISLGVTGGVMVEDPTSLLDDFGEGIKRSFWQVNYGATGILKEIRFQGTVIETSELVSSSVAATDYPNGMILLTQDYVDDINASSNPVIDLPALRLGDANYALRRRIIREILEDDSIKVTEIQEFESL